MNSKSKRKGQWNQEALEKALKAISNKEMSDYKAEKEFGIPRRTLRRYIKSGNKTKAKQGRKAALNEETSAELCSRITRLAEVGYPITPKILRLCVYKYCKENNIKHQFSDIKQIASYKWARKFLKDNPIISIRKSQNLNPARAQKLNKHVVADHFDKISTIFEENDIFGKPERLFNMDEKGCRLNLHKEPKVLAQKGARRVHIIGNEHGENVSIVSCASATGAVIPPMILFKGKRMKPEFADDLPAGSVCRMTEKGSMTTNAFVEWLHHFGCHKPAGRCVLIFDGAKSHLDYEIVIVAEQYNTILYCLPSNTTHELQPLDKAVFRSFEYHWDEEVMLFWQNHGDRILTKQRFGRIFSKVWEKSMTLANIKSGFKATGLYPYDPLAIPEVAFAPSAASELPNPEHSGTQSANTAPSSSGPEKHSSPQPGTSGEADRMCNLRKEVDSVESATIHSENETDDPDTTKTSFSDLLPSPKLKIRHTSRNISINSKGIVLKKSLFQKGDSEDKAPGSTVGSTRSAVQKSRLSKRARARADETPAKSRLKNKKESWYCSVCNEDAVKDMRMCIRCTQYVHEECVGLTEQDKGPFNCPKCVD